MTEKPNIRPSVNFGTFESSTDKIVRKSKESPFLVVGLTGCVFVCLFGAYKFKNRGTMSTSLFLMQLRVAAQGTVVAACTAGVVNQLYHRLIDPPKTYND